MREHGDLSGLDLHAVTAALVTDGWEIEEGSGRLTRE